MYRKVKEQCPIELDNKSIIYHLKQLCINIPNHRLQDTANNDLFVELVYTRDDTELYINDKPSLQYVAYCWWQFTIGNHSLLQQFYATYLKA